MGSVSLLLFGLALASCSADQPGKSDGSEHSNGRTSIGKTVGTSDDPFRWPTADDHPRLELEAELPDGEGTITIELLPELAPESVERVLALSRDGYYDGTTFHRVIPGFMIQGGDPNSRDRDPTNDGRGGDPTPIPDEFSAAPFERGVVGLANRGQKGSTGPQLFIMQRENRALDGQYNVIGRVVAGLELVDAIAAVETDASGRWGPKDRPLRNVFIRRLSSAKPGDGAHPPGTLASAHAAEAPAAHKIERDPRRKAGVR